MTELTLLFEHPAWFAATLDPLLLQMNPQAGEMARFAVQVMGTA